MKYLTLLLSVIMIGYGESKAFPLSKEAEISILTCSPGTELYSLFGHTAIRVYDSSNHTDLVFNYGTFDFSTPHFYLKYAQGLLPYQLTVGEFPHFLASYKEEQRTVYSQKLHLDSVQKQKMFDLLLENYRPENRSYLYNFLWDNCTTRSRDILARSIHDTIEWKIADKSKSFWNLLDEYLKASPWVQWGIHSILGQGGNRKADTYQTMFLPDYLMQGLNTAFIREHPLAGKAEILYEAPPAKNDYPWYIHPIFIFAVSTFILIFLLQKLKCTFFLNTRAILLFLFSGILGCLIVFLGGFTAHPITAPNWNILWANPLNLVVIPFIIRKILPRFIQIYLKIYLILLIAAIPAWFLLQPAVPMASVSLIVLMIYLCTKIRNKSKSSMNTTNTTYNN